MRAVVMMAVVSALASGAMAGALPQIHGYGVNAAGNLFRFDVAAPADVTTIGPVGFVPEGIDFRPGTNELYAIDVGPNTTQLYTLNVNTGAATPVGAGFNSTGVNYALLPSQTFGFDFNPATLQGDNSMRIRLVATNNVNLRLNSSTGQIASVDGDLAFGNASSPFIDGAAYINNLPNAGGETTLYDMDSRNDSLLIQNPPNSGTVTTVGPFGVTVDALRGIGFDIYTPLGSTDVSNDDDLAYAVLQRPDAPVNGPLGAYLLYRVNLDSGQITNGALVGPAATPFDFDGGFALSPVAIPEPTSLAAIGLLALARRRR